VRVRVMGGTDWKRLWVVLSTPNAPEDKEDEKKTRRRSFFGLGEKEKEVVQCQPKANGVSDLRLRDVCDRKHRDACLVLHGPWLQCA
jgi:hypothetical protein